MTSFTQDDIIDLEIKDAWISCHFDLLDLPIPAKGANPHHNFTPVSLALRHIDSIYSPCNLLIYLLIQMQ